MNYKQQRDRAGRQYVVYHLKMIELLHFILLNTELTADKVPSNVMGHDVDRFRETLLGAAVNTFMAICDDPANTNIREIWKILYPKHAKAVDRIWTRNIAPGEAIMKAYRDSAGAHGDKIHRYFAGKFRLFNERDRCLDAMFSLLSLSLCLEKRQGSELPGLSSEIEAILLDVELKWQGREVFNRRWLREMHLIKAGGFTRRFA